MPTGLEIAGLALAILPLVIEAAKVYAKGLNSIHNVVSARRRDSKLQDFYDSFWWETELLHRRLRNLIYALPLLCDECKITLETDASLASWEDTVVKDSLLEYFGTQSDVDAFLLVLTRILELVDKLVKEKHTALSTTDKDHTKMYQKLKKLIADRKSDTTSSTFFERFRFFKEEKNRDTCIKNIQTWNQRLKVLIMSSKAQTKASAVIEKKSAPSFVEIRELFNLLFSTVASHWDCSCHSRHEAMLCLKAWPSSIRHSIPTQLEFDVLLSSKARLGRPCHWLESTVLVRGGRTTFADDKQLLPQVCELLSQQDSCHKLMIETNAGRPTLWRLRSQPKRFDFLNLTPPRSLSESLSIGLSTLKTKLVLALTFAYALIQCLGSPCCKKMLQKESIFFCSLTENQIDFEQPYLSTRFESGTQETDVADMSVQHRHPRILDLGILLLEIHKGKSISTFRSTTENSNPSPNTDLMVARRVVDGLEDWCSEPYKDAVRACLEIPWVPAGKKVDLNDPETSDGFYINVIKPLEGELDYLFRIKF